MEERAALGGRGFVCISSIDWDFLWQGHQEIASRFATSGCRVVYVENTGARTVRPSDWRRIVARLRNAVGPLRRSHPGRGSSVTVLSPLLVPFPRSRIANAVNEHLLIPALARRIGRMVGDDAILFTFLPTPTALRLIKELRRPRSRVVYYCIADFQELSDLGQTLTRSERELVETADLVFVQTQSFAEAFRALNPRTYVFQFGVNLDVFDRPPLQVGVPPELADLPRPLIGYSGGIHAHVDFDLLRAVARSTSGTVVLVGLVQTDPGPLRHEPNVRFLGARSFEQLPDILRRFDVGLVPYALTEYTRTVFPTKLFEYLAAGLPVVSTDLPEVRKVSLPEWAVRIGGSPDAFVQQIERALASAEPNFRERRRRLADGRDWKRIVGQMAELILARDEGRA